MATRTKIKIMDIAELRAILDSEYEVASQTKLCKYAMALAAHIMEICEYPDRDNRVIKNGVLVNEEWQLGKARVHEVRQAGFQIHQMAKSCNNIIYKTALRVVGQAVATGHMREHAMVASDYAVKVVNLLHPNDGKAVEQERLWQIKQMRSF